MLLGDTVFWLGDGYFAVGFEPMGLPGRTAELQDVTTGRRVRVPIEDLEHEANSPEQEEPR